MLHKQRGKDVDKAKTVRGARVYRAPLTNTHMVKSSDNIIFAETAAVDNLCLITRNIEDFKNINITILNPFD
jgi:predicted nucleic acid-binding protein